MASSQSVAVERRMDLASLFCLIARHGPAVAAAVVAVISVLAAVLIYRRTVRGKRGKATAAAAGRDAESRGEEPDAAVSREEEEEAEEADIIPAESTEVDDGASPDLPKDPDLFHNHLEVRHRSAAAAAAAAAEDSFTVLKTVETKPPLSSDNETPEYRHAASGASQSPEWHDKPDRAAEMYRDEVSQRLSEPEPEKRDAFNSHQDVKDGTEDGTEVIRYGGSCLKESTDEEKRREEEQVFKAEDTDVSKDVTTGERSPLINTGPEEEHVQCVMKNMLNQTPCLNENGDRVRLQGDKTAQEVKDSEMVNGVKDEHEEEDRCPGSTVNANHCIDSSVTAEEEEEEECVEHQLIAQQTEICPSAQVETRWPSSRPPVYPRQLNGQTDQVTDSDNVLHDEGGVTGQVAEEEVVKDMDPAAAECDAHQQLQTEEDHVLPQMTRGDVPAEERRDGSSLLLTSLEDSPAPSPYEDRQGGRVMNEELERGVEGVAVSPDIDASDICTVPPACDGDQVTAPAETEDTPCPQLSPVRHNQLSGPNDEELEEMSHPPLPSAQQDKQIGQTVANEASDESKAVSDRDPAAWDDGDVASVANREEISRPPTPPVCQNQQPALDEASADAGPAEDEVTASVKDEETSCPAVPSPYQDQQSGQTRDNEGLEEESVPAGAAAVTCDGDEELSSFLKDQQSSQTGNDEDYTAEVAAPVPVEEMSLPLSFVQSEQRGHEVDNISSPGADEESGVSSMTFSPDSEEPSEGLGLPAMCFGHHVIESHHSVFSKSVTNEDGSIESMVFVDGAICVSSGGNEDVCGRDIEDSYHQQFDHFTAQIAASIGSRAEEPEKQVDAKDVDVSEIKGKKEGTRVAKKEKAQAGNEEEEDCERTEISIMEATMDNNEWIEDTNYQVLPWMNLSLKSVDQDHTKNDKLPRTEQQQDLTVTLATTGATGTDARDADIPFPTEDKQTSADNNNKKVVAVPPMPQNVNVTFRVHYLTHSPYQTVAITGNQQELGSWKGFVPLERAKDGYWASVIGLPAESRVEWKFVVVDKGEVCRWEECRNRDLETGGGDDLYVEKCWGFL